MICTMPHLKTNTAAWSEAVFAHEKTLRYGVSQMSGIAIPASCIPAGKGYTLSVN
jgi:hypothetical protein